MRKILPLAISISLFLGIGVSFLQSHLASATHPIDTSWPIDPPQAHSTNYSIEINGYYPYETDDDYIETDDVWNMPDYDGFMAIDATVSPPDETIWVRWYVDCVGADDSECVRHHHSVQYTNDDGVATFASTQLKEGTWQLCAVADAPDYSQFSPNGDDEDCVIINT